MRIAITGSGGRLGKALVRELRAQGDSVLAFNRVNLPLNDLKQVESILHNHTFDVLVNCAAITNVDFCEMNRDAADHINTYAVETMASVCDAKGAKLIQISTDYVFDGLKGDYSEADEPNPMNYYGQSKLNAENAAHLVLRMSRVFGPDKESFIDQQVKKAIAGEPVKAPADLIASPTYTIDAAKIIRQLMEEAKGVVHVSNHGECSWLEFTQHALDCARMAGVPLKTQTATGILSSEVKAFCAYRPINTSFNTDKLTEALGEQPQAWQHALYAHVCNAVGSHT